MRRLIVIAATATAAAAGFYRARPYIAAKLVELEEKLDRIEREANRRQASV